jgi:alginate O-acetyltransferase complex protein AlgI
MVFTSPTFFIFFVSFFIFYWFVFGKNVKYQNIILLLGSYIFYGWADWRFLFLIVAISVLNFYLAIYIEKSKKYKRLLLFIGMLQGIGGLFIFKYYNFLIISSNLVLHGFKINTQLQTLNIIIPLGISFFTFRIISYLLDVDKGKISSIKDWVVFFNYVSFFPSVIAGPIDKARQFVPYLEKRRSFNYNKGVDGMRQILWGLLKKVVIADNCSSITNQIFDSYQTLPGSTLLIGAFLYTIQIYADFSGYSDMAIGLSRLLGFEVTKNFNFPLFSQNIAEFWRKWHMSLTSWLTEYVYTPLNIAMRDWGNLGMILAIVINFTICGIWHGANWTYVLFGFLHGVYFIPLILNGTMNKKKKGSTTHLPSFNELINILLTFVLVMFTFVIFRSESLEQAFNYYKYILSLSIFAKPDISFIDRIGLVILFVSILMLITLEWLNRSKEFALADLRLPLLVRWIFYIVISIVVLYYSGNNYDFIYAKF